MVYVIKSIFVQTNWLTEQTLCRCLDMLYHCWLLLLLLPHWFNSPINKQTDGRIHSKFLLSSSLWFMLCHSSAMYANGHIHHIQSSESQLHLAVSVSADTYQQQWRHRLIYLFFQFTKFVCILLNPYMCI